MNELVTASGMSKGAFYHYFNSKDQIYKETLDKYFFSYLEAFVLNYNDNQSFKENLYGIFLQFTGMAKEIENLIGPGNPMISYYHTVLDAAIRSPEIHNQITKYYEQYMISLSDWIRIAQKKKEMRTDLNAEILSKHICSLMEGIMIVYSFQNKEKNIVKYFNEIFYQFFDILQITD